MCGWVKWFWDVLEIELWKEVTPLRLFVLVFIHASREGGRTVNGIKLKRGQSTSSNTNLAKDFGYREFRGEKHYLKITINRSGEKLMKSAGTLSSQLNMTKYMQMESLIFFLC